TSVYGGLGFAASKQSMFYGVINESMRVNSGGGVDDESIELVFLKRENVREFAFDESKVKAAGLLFALIWFFKGKRW
ncbi:MAG: NUDIX hydrolase, partial [Campylobacter sp.]|nr:NUDIX hydrolase [Campylobacter sp.]